MEKMCRIKRSVSLLIISAILILCAGFLIVSCGNAPQQKTKNADKDSFAMDLSACPTAPLACVATLEGSEATPVPSVKQDITMEAWIKSKSATLNGVIFSRMDASSGAMLLVNNNQPKFTIRRAPVGSDVASAERTPLSECVSFGTSTECVVDAVTQVGSSTAGVGAQMTITAPTSTVTIAAPGIFANSSTTVNSFTTSDGTIITLNSGTANGIQVVPQATAALNPPVMGAILTLPAALADVHISSTPIRATTYPNAGNTFIDTSTTPNRTITLNAPNTARAIMLRTQDLTNAGPLINWPINVDNAEDTFPVTLTSFQANTARNLVQDAWTHIAGVVTSENQGTGPNNCAADTDGNGTVQGAETPHLAIYIDGVLNNCATSGGQFADNPPDPVTQNLTINGSQLGGAASFALTTVGNLDAVVDELRLWITAKSVADVAACMDAELGIGGFCDRGDANLAAYYRLNEGEGVDVTDFSGNGISGSFETAQIPATDTTPLVPAGHFDTGWVLRTDAQTPAKAD